MVGFFRKIEANGFTGCGMDYVRFKTEPCAALVNKDAVVRRTSMSELASHHIVYVIATDDRSGLSS